MDESAKPLTGTAEKREELKGNLPKQIAKDDAEKRNAIAEIALLHYEFGEAAQTMNKSTNRTTATATVASVKG